MKELLIAACLLVFVLVRIKNIRAQGGYGVFAFPAIKTDKHYTWVYPGYIGGNAKVRRRILRKYRSPVGIPVKPERERHTPPVKQTQKIRVQLVDEPTSATFPLRQKMKRASAYLPSKVELKGLFKKAQLRREKRKAA